MDCLVRESTDEITKIKLEMEIQEKERKLREEERGREKNKKNKGNSWRKLWLWKIHGSNRNEMVRNAGNRRMRTAPEGNKYPRIPFQECTGREE